MRGTYFTGAEKHKVFVETEITPAHRMQIERLMYVHFTLFPKDTSSAGNWNVHKDVN